MQKKKVSIVMCTYNGGKYLREQLDTILAQTYPIYEIIIQDDGSTDNTIAIVHEYEKLYPAIIKFYQTTGHIGAHMNFKTALVKATGDYVAPADQDDIWMPNKIEVLMNAIGDELLATCYSTVRFANGEECVDYLKPCVVLEQMVFGGTIAGHTILYKNCIKEQLEYACTTNVAFDKALAMIAAAQSTCVVVPQSLQIWRRHEGVVTINTVQASDIPAELGLNARSNKLKQFVWAAINISKHKSKGIVRHFMGLQNMFHYLGKKELSHLCMLVKEQTTWTYVQAGFVCAKKRNYITPPLFAKENCKNKIKRWLYAFRYPFTYWQSNHTIEHL